MSKGRRYDEEPKLNLVKVFAVLVAIAVIIMIIVMLTKLFTKEEKVTKITSASYFTVYKDNKWGVIDSAGNYVIDPSYQEMIVIPDSKMGVFICTYDVDYVTGEYKTKVLSKDNKEIYTNYQKVEAIQNKDEQNNLWYEKNILKVQNNDKFGLITLAGKEIVPVEYDKITVVDGIKNSYKIQKDGKYGIVDGEGKIVIEPQYAEIDVLGNDNKSGFIVKNDEGKFGIVDYSNNQILEVKYDEVKKVYGNDLYVVKTGGSTKIVSKEGNDVVTTGFDTIKKITSNSIIFENSNKCGVMNTTGEVVIEAQYDDLKEAKSGFLIAKKSDNYGIISIDNEEKVAFEYKSISYNEKADIYVLEDNNYNNQILNNNFENKASGILLDLNIEKGYFKLRVSDNYKYYNFKFEEKEEKDIFPNRTLFLSKNNNKYGYVDKNGKIIVDYIYDDAVEQNDYGYEAVKLDGKWGCLDSNGKVVQEPTYNLDNYLLVDFVGRWHLGLDLNMAYYNQL